VANILSGLFLWSSWGNAADDCSPIPQAIRRAFSDTLEIDRLPFRGLVSHLEHSSRGRTLPDEKLAPFR
jgi:hypothetical protein